MHPTSHQPSLSPSNGASLAVARASFLRRVYLLMTGAVGVAAATAAATTTLGLEHGTVLKNGAVIPPAIAWSINHPFLMLGLMFGAVFGAGAVIRRPGLNLLALFGIAGVMGFVAGPSIWFAQFKASQGQALTGSPVLHAAGLSIAAFVGLSAYAIVSRRDFSSLGAFLSMGLLVLLGASVLNLFLGASALSMAISSVAILLFGGYVLYDTSRMLQDGEDDPVPVALSQFLNLFNLFLALLRIFSGGRRDLETGGCWLETGGQPALRPEVSSLSSPTKQQRQREGWRFWVNEDPDPDEGSGAQLQDECTASQMAWEA